MRPHRKQQSNANAGFTLIEVLITLVIFSIGLLGLAALQANSMVNSHNAYLRSQATLMANDMADRMRANMVGVADNRYNALNGIPVNPNCITDIAGCTPAQIAIFDAFEWNTTLNAELPSGAGTVTGNSADFIITVRWDERRNGAIGTGCDPADADDLQCIAVSLTLL
ncbi:Type IV fimbrial biogenesis protein PilV [hydrothermal vent metagenome]|uniref:Type IV fimbrial biogenesis protein PilV n=1 Tax=hydrothermal vent metagenome TaxID=652676 RepID=A0A3B0ZNZ5_9ZZZZ